MYKDVQATNWIFHLALYVVLKNTQIDSVYIWLFSGLH